MAASHGARAQRFRIPPRRWRGRVRHSHDPSRRRLLRNAVLGTGAPPHDPGTPAGPERTVVGTVLDASPHVLVICDDSGGPEHRFALTDATTVWRGSRVQATALRPGQHVVVRRTGPRSADRIWADIGRVTGTIADRSADTLVVDQGHARERAVVTIARGSADRIQVRFPWLRPGYLIDVIGLRAGGALQALIPAANQPPYRADQVPRPPLRRGRLPHVVSGTVSWHEPAGSAPVRCGVAYPAIDPDTGCGHDGECDLAGTCARLPYLSVGSTVGLRNDCTHISATLPVTGCGSAASRFCDRCLVCGTSPRGRIADLTVAAFVELGGELDKSCFNATMTMGG